MQSEDPNKSLRGQLADYDSPLDLDAGWAALQRARAPRRKRRAGGWWWLGVFLLVAATAAWWYRSSDGIGSPPPAPRPISAGPTSPSAKDTRGPKTAVTTSPTGVPALPTIPRTPGAAPAAVAVPPGAPTPAVAPGAPTTSSAALLIPLPFDGTSRAVSSPPVERGDNGSRPPVPPAITADDRSPIPPARSGAAPPNPTVGQPRVVFRSLRLPYLTLAALPLADAKISGHTFFPPPPPTTGAGLALSAGFFGEYGRSFRRDGPTADPLEALRVATETPLDYRRTGVQLTGRTPGQWLFGTRLHHGLHTDRLRLVDSRTDSLLIEDAIIRITERLDGSRAVETGAATGVRRTTARRLHYLRYASVGIDVFGGRRWRLADRWQLHTTLGLRLSVWQSATGNTFGSATDWAQVAPLDTLDYRTGGSWSSTGTFGLSYRPAPHWQVELAAAAQYGHNNQRTGSPREEYRHELGLRLGIGYHW